MSGITIERKVTSSSRNASPSTHTNTSGAWDFIELLKSTEVPVSPMVFTVTPGTLPIVAGMTLLRSSASALIEVALVPFPASGIETRAAWCEALTSTLIG